MKTNDDKMLEMYQMRLEKLKRLQAKIKAEMIKEEEKVFPKHERN
jgi:hypothetical protein